MKAIWNGQTIAESDETVIVDGNHYFPVVSVNKALLLDSEKTTRCFWKGKANYYSIQVDDQINKDAAWYYANPKKAAHQIKDRVAFWKGVQVIDC